MKSSSRRTAILLATCADQRGLVSTITNFVSSNGGNIVYLDQHVDESRGVFSMRVEWDLEDFAIASHDIEEEFGREIGRPRQMWWLVRFSDDVQRMAIFVSKLPYCLYDLLARWKANEWRVEIPFVISNHEHARPVAERFGVPYHVFPITLETKEAQEEAELSLLHEHGIDVVALARYMQILSPRFIRTYPDRIINIHHSFLPAFAGSRPYHQAHARGVKLIGATSHYVTEELDAGPIISQDVTPVTHRDSVQDLIRKGRDLEKLVLARAVWAHLQRKVLCYDNRTIVFD